MMARQLWTDEEIQILRDLYVQSGSPAIRKLLPHRTPNQIAAKAYRLGLRAPEGARQRRSYDWAKHKKRDPVTGYWLQDEDPPDPTPEEIFERAQAIRENWNFDRCHQVRVKQVHHMRQRGCRKR